jgi:hypothetical protein
VSVDGVRVLDGAAYLAASSAGRAPALGPSVVVIGGGSAAMDAARSARRAGHAVTVLALESRAQMPAQREELDEALAEGVTLLDGAMLQQLARRADGLRLHGVRVRFERGARPGEFRVEPLPGTEFRCAADAVLVSIGQDPDLAPFDGVLPADGPLLAAAADGATAADGVWTGGDVASAWRASSPRRSAWASAPRWRSTAGCARRTRPTPTPAPKAPTVPLRPLPPATTAHRCRWRPSPPGTTATRRAPPPARARRPSACATAPRSSSGWRRHKRWPRRRAASRAAAAPRATTASSLLPRPGGVARRRRLPRRPRLLQGLRPVRARVPDRVDADGRGGPMNAPEVLPAPSPVLLTGNHALAWAARLARPKVVPGLPDHAADAGAGAADRVPGGGEFDAEIITPSRSTR